MDRGRGRARAAAVVAATAAVVLAGCSGGDDPSAAAPPSAPSPSAASTDTATAAPAEATGSAVPRPAAPEAPSPRRGHRGQKAFARYVMAAWSWSLRTNDAGPLLDASRSHDQPCRGCRRLEKELAKRDKDGWYVDFPGLAVDRTRLRHDAPDVVATSKVDIPESDSFFEDGSYRSTSPAHPNATFTVRMRWAKDEYRLVSFGVG